MENLKLCDAADNISPRLYQLFFTSGRVKDRRDLP